MTTVTELPDVFQKDLKVGDEMIIMDSHVRLEEIELVMKWKIIDDTKINQSQIQVSVPMTDCENPFPYNK